MKFYIYLKSNLFKALYFCGVLKWLEKNARSDIILGYHHILPEDHEWIKFLQPGMYVTTKTFQEHIIFLKNNYEIVPLHKIQLRTQKKKCVITFDDGWSDNFKYAYPLLKKYNVPATIFLTTGMIEKHTWAWPDRLSFYINEASQEELIKLINEITNRPVSGGRKFKFNLLKRKNRFSVIEDCIAIIKKYDKKKICSVMRNIDNLMRNSKTKLENTSPWLTWSEISEMTENNIYFGSHTHKHIILTNTSTANAENEIEVSINIISKRLNNSICTFSYPNGNYDEIIIKLLRDHNIKYSVTTEKGFINQSKDLLRLKRIMIHNDIANNSPSFIYQLISPKYKFLG